MPMASRNFFAALDQLFSSTSFLPSWSAASRRGSPFGGGSAAAAPATVRRTARESTAPARRWRGLMEVPYPGRGADSKLLLSRGAGGSGTAENPQQRHPCCDGPPREVSAALRWNLAAAAAGPGVDGLNRRQVGGQRRGRNLEQGRLDGHGLSSLDVGPHVKRLPARGDDGQAVRSGIDLDPALLEVHQRRIDI